ncbi:MAG: hypothetical protein KKG06_01695 [Bacteroidetes bacterium]|nr:hypothetical protein [Bacteroidota bacterium]MBU1421893.1 hypothetical protein [Bacteroidota bacterium]
MNQDELLKRGKAWASIWKDRCEAIYENKKEDQPYSDHLFFLLEDLREEINENPSFKSNRYGKEYFLHHLSQYCSTSSKKSSTQSCSTKQEWVGKSDVYLSLILEPLSEHYSNTFTLSDLVTLIDTLQTFQESLDCYDFTVDLLLKKIERCTSEITEDKNVRFLTDTLVLYFERRGISPRSIDSLGTDVMETFEDVKYPDRIITNYPNAPEQGTLLLNDYENSLKSFYSKLTMQSRIDCFKQFIRYKHEQYEVIFRIDGLELFDGGISITKDIRIYDPRKEKHIKKFSWEGRKYHVEQEDRAGNCLAVRLQGRGSASLENLARQMAERALGVLSSKRKREEPLILSRDYSVCNEAGDEIAFGGDKSKKEPFFPAWGKIIESYQKYFNDWITNPKPNSAAKKWLVSMDWYRSSIESDQPSQELLNAWFAIEHLTKDEQDLSIRLPGFLYSRESPVRTNQQWLDRRSMAITQFILSIVVLKTEMREIASEVSSYFFNQISQNFYSYKISNHLLTQFYSKGNNTWKPQVFIEIIDEILNELTTNNYEPARSDVLEVKRLFYEVDFTKSILREKIWQIKDDVYNIYRIRNMLVHGGVTSSRLTKYYANRCREYAYDLLRCLQWKLMGSEREHLEKDHSGWLRQIIVDANIALEKFEKGDMNAYRDWIFKG